MADGEAGGLPGATEIEDLGHGVGGGVDAGNCSWSGTQTAPSPVARNGAPSSGPTSTTAPPPGDRVDAGRALTGQPDPQRTVAEAERAAHPSSAIGSETASVCGSMLTTPPRTC